MRPDFPGGYPPGGRGRRWRGEPLEPYERLITYSGGGERRRRKRRSVWLKHMGDVLLWLSVGLLIFLVAEGLPYLLKFSPGDAMRYSGANIFGKASAFGDALRHKREISKMKLSHDGKTVTLTEEKGTLTDVSGEGYGKGDEDEFQRDVDEARRILKEWGLD